MPQRELDVLDEDGASGTRRGRRSARGHVPRWLRVFLPAVLILVWLAGAAVGGPYFGKVSEVSSNDQTTYLPESADATTVQELLGEFNDSDTVPAVVVVTSDTQLSESETTEIEEAVAQLPEVPGVQDDLSPAIPSEDGFAVQAFVPIGSEEDLGAVVEEVSQTLSAELSNVDVFVTGPAGFSADLAAGFAGIDGLLLAVSLAAVFLILIVVYRSLLLPIAVLATSVFALTVSLLTVWWLAEAEILLLSGQTQGILFILVIGAATDYSLLYVARYREALRVHEDRWTASWKGLRGSFEPILASGGTVIAGLLCLLLSDLKSNSTLGPVASIGIVFAMISALTFLPAVLYAFGRAAFWPRRPRFEPEVVAAEGGVPNRGVWARTGRFVARRPRRIWIATTLLLFVGALGLTQLDAQGVPQSELVLGESEAREGQVALGEHFPEGSGSPAYVVTAEDSLQDTADVLLENPGVDGVTAVTEDDAGSAPVDDEGISAYGPGAPAPDPAVVDGSIMLQATLSAPADSAEAQDTVRDLRSTYASAETDVLVGGVTATALDTNEAAIHDRNLIIPIVLVVILVILMVLLRSVLAPVLLVLTTVLSFGTALGVSALVFNGLFDFPGADPTVPLYGFVFLVALGIDYNIFLMTRVREEALAHGTRSGVIRGLTVTGGVITSAGVVLAATFAALSVIPILFLAQIAFIVAFGVLLDTFLVRALLVPALVRDIGPAVWWPSKLAKRTEEESPVPDRA
ncbi:MMPL family transporter [Nesterenkonia lutea]|uniref:RND superfamily putative drug exporter n=1 Tax=Nesterenkonia lutea TaxID=272919 RepID=A0ABR9JHI0_9MICC|nr:MMPL family transporter [Nesterenkonia lutea]MBE1525377.1 RND superfamily putative drug exporter [Nesterenkonia lutea]